jgi:hypothetical protein
MEEAPGTQLEDVWASKKISEKTSIVKGLIEIEKKMLSISFTEFVLRQKAFFLTNPGQDTAIFILPMTHFQVVKQLRSQAMFQQN